MFTHYFPKMSLSSGENQSRLIILWHESPLLTISTRRFEQHRYSESCCRNIQKDIEVYRHNSEINTHLKAILKWPHMPVHVHVHSWLPTLIIIELDSTCTGVIVCVISVYTFFKEKYLSQSNEVNPHTQWGSDIFQAEEKCLVSCESFCWQCLWDLSRSNSDTVIVNII